MSLQSKYATVVATELRHHAVWEPGEPVRLGDYGILQHGRFSVQGNVKDDYGLEFEVIRSRKREYAFRSDGVSETRGDTRTSKPGVATELRVGFRRADALYVSSPSAWTEHIKGLGRLLGPLQKDPSWRSEWVVVTRIYMASPAIILLSNADNADVKIHLGADGVAVAGDSTNEIGEQGSVALQLTGVHGALFMGLHRVTKHEVGDVLPRRRLLSRVMVLAGAGLVGGGALATWLVIGMVRPAADGIQQDATTIAATPESAGPTIVAAADKSRDVVTGGEVRPPLVTPESEDSIGLGHLGKVGFGGGGTTASEDEAETGGPEAAATTSSGDTQVNPTGAAETPPVIASAPNPTTGASGTSVPVAPLDPTAERPPEVLAPVAGPPPASEGPPWWIGVVVVIVGGLLLLVAWLRRRLDVPVEAVEPTPPVDAPR